MNRWNRSRGLGWVALAKSISFKHCPVLSAWPIVTNLIPTDTVCKLRENMCQFLAPFISYRLVIPRRDNKIEGHSTVQTNNYFKLRTWILSKPQLHLITKLALYDYPVCVRWFSFIRNHLLQNECSVFSRVFLGTFSSCCKLEFNLRILGMHYYKYIEFFIYEVISIQYTTYPSVKCIL